MKKISFEEARSKLGTLAVALLAFNFLLYSFFEYEEIKLHIRICAVLLLLLVFLFKSEYKKKEIFLLIVALYILMLGGSASMNVALLVLCILSLTNKEEIVYKLFFRISLILSGIVLISLSSGMVQQNIYTFGERTRNTLGFNNVNGASIFFFSLITLYLMSRKVITFVHLIISCIAAICLFVFTNTRTTLLGMLIFFMFFIVQKKLKKQWCRLVIVGFELICLTSAFVWKLPGLNSQLLNKLLSLRPQIFNEYIDSNKWYSFFVGGSRIQEIDNFYLVFLYNVGFPLYCLAAYVVIKATKILIECEKKKEIAFICSMLGICLVESVVLRCEILCAILFWYITIQNGMGISKEMGK